MVCLSVVLFLFFYRDWFSAEILEAISFTHRIVFFTSKLSVFHFFYAFWSKMLLSLFTIKGEDLEEIRDFFKLIPQCFCQIFFKYTRQLKSHLLRFSISLKHFCECLKPYSSHHYGYFDFICDTLLWSVLRVEKGGKLKQSLCY